MWVSKGWETEDDVLRDLTLTDEYRKPAAEGEAQVLDTILQYRKQMEQNKQKPLNSDIDDSACYIISGRGRGIRDRVIRPGGIIDYHPSDDTELKKQIRQVSSIGYSNEFIAQSIKAKGYDPEQCHDENSSFKLVSTSSSSSGRSSLENTPTKKKIVT